MLLEPKTKSDSGCPTNPLLYEQTNYEEQNAISFYSNILNISFIWVKNYLY